MAVGLDNPALGLVSEVKPRQQLTLRTGLVVVKGRVGFQPTTRRFVADSSMP